MSDKSTFRLLFETLKTIQFTFLEMAEEIDYDAIQFKFDLSVRPEPELKRLAVALEARVVKKSNSEESTDEVSFARIVTLSSFITPDIEACVSGEPLILSLPRAALLRMVDLAIGATRGALATRGAGSFLEYVIMPTVDVDSFFEQGEFVLFPVIPAPVDPPSNPDWP